MKILLSSLLTICLIGFATTDTYSQDFIYAHKTLLIGNSLKIADKINDFDDYIFLPDEHIEEIEPVFEEDAIKNNIFSKRSR
ncbi:hypothetical protein [Orbus mooreae]|uniref:hypothetical protein n=1 Tax=Orbus mooreae TaxID=3074107 RepID=UPI00370D32B0